MDPYQVQETMQHPNGELPTQQFASTDPSPSKHGVLEEPNSTQQPNQTSEESALLPSRPLHNVMIVMAGQSGAGKSATMKLFFAGIKSAEALDVVEYGKQLCITSQSPPVKGTFSFVDLSNNWAAVTKFRTEHFDLNVLSDKNVYPNMIIFIVSACDNRMVGPDSNLQKSLVGLKETMLVDGRHANVIVTVTHAMAIPLKLYTVKTEEIACNISQAVYDVLGISNVKVVFVENLPEDYGMQKPEGSEFYELPNGKLSHYNLIEAMMEQFDTNNDRLGKLFCDWYFEDERCDEKGSEASLLYKIDLQSEKEINKRTHLQDDGTRPKVPRFDIPEFSFQYIGRGYCPRTENLKNVTVFPINDTKCIDLLGEKYAVPSCVNVNDSEDVQSYLLTTVSKEKYQMDKITAYGLKDEHKALLVNVHSSGKWVKDGLLRKSNSEVVFVYEKRLVEVTLDQPHLSRCTKRELVNELQRLPQTYEPKNYYIFNEFFSKWGTHFVCQEWLGGYVEVEVRVESSTYNEQKGKKIFSELQSCFMRNGGDAETSHSMFIEPEETVTTFGGDPSTYLTSLQDVTQTRLREWEESVRANPTELKHCFRIQPYYKLVDEQNSKSLSEATQDYLSGSMFAKINSPKRDFGYERNDSLHSRETESLMPKKKLRKCFPMSAKIYTKEGPVESCKLVPGSEVWTLSRTSNLDNNQVKYTEFYTNLHYDPDAEAEFLVLNLDNEQGLTVSKNHLIFALRSGEIRAVVAKKMHVGDKVLFVNEDKKIQYVKVSSIATKEGTGIFSPLTGDGTLIVDGVLVSCYASVESFFVAHTSLAPLRLWYIFKNAVCCLSSNSIGMLIPRLNYSSSTARSRYRPSTGIHIFARILVLLRRLLWLKV